MPPLATVCPGNPGFQSAPSTLDSGQWERGMLWYFDTFGEWRLGLSIHNKELGLHTHLDQRAHSSSKTPLPCSPLSFYLYSEGDKHYINTEIVKIISRCESRNESYIRNEGDTHSCPSVCVLFIFVSRLTSRDPVRSGLTEIELSVWWEFLHNGFERKTRL